MTLSIYLNSLIDDIYADSALTALLRLHDPKFATTVITPDQRQALIRQLNAAAAYVAAPLAPRISAIVFPAETDADPQIELTIDCPTDASPDSLTHLFSSAIVFATLHFLAVKAGDNQRADRYENRIQTFSDAFINAIDSIRHCPSLTPRYY